MIKLRIKLRKTLWGKEQKIGMKRKNSRRGKLEQKVERLGRPGGTAESRV